MKVTLSRLVWALAAVFVAVIAVEAVRPVAPEVASVVAGPTSRTVVAGPTSRTVVAGPTSRAAAAASAEPVAAWMTTILARPLFTPDRRPPAASTASAVSADAPQSLPRLAGIIVSPRSRTAIFANGSDHSTTADEGATVGEWRVVAIHAEAVDLSGPQGDRTVRPSYSNDPAPPAPVQAGFTPGMPFTPPAGNLLPTPTGPNGRPLNTGAPFAGATPPNNAPGAVSRKRP